MTEIFTWSTIGRSSGKWRRRPPQATCQRYMRRRSAVPEHAATGVSPREKGPFSMDSSDSVGSSWEEFASTEDERVQAGQPHAAHLHQKLPECPLRSISSISVSDGWTVGARGHTRGIQHTFLRMHGICRAWHKAWRPCHSCPRGRRRPRGRRDVVRFFFCSLFCRGAMPKGQALATTNSGWEMTGPQSVGSLLQERTSWTEEDGLAVNRSHVCVRNARPVEETTAVRWLKLR
jgi:hypothetical protein